MFVFSPELFESMKLYYFLNQLEIRREKSGDIGQVVIHDYQNEGLI